LEAAQVRVQFDATGEVKHNDIICVEHANSRLIEIVRGVQASPERVRTAMEWARKRGKVSVVVKDFVSTRIMRRQAQAMDALVKEGLPLDEIQRALLDFGITLAVPFSSGPEAKSPIAHRVTMAMADEGAAIMKEGLALRESDIDLICTLACGFPTWRGGPLFYAKASNPR
jgi:3-hydroxyacyl-CoA dehydrogenase